MSRFVAMLVVASLAGTAFAVATGRIVGPDGRPVPGAKICEATAGVPENCVPVGPDGVYRVESAPKATLIVRANGYVPKPIAATAIAAPVELQRAATLLVLVVDAGTKLPVPSGRVMIDTPEGRRIGDFVPFNKSGVRISTLDPGDVFVRAEADGYVPSGPVPITLVSGASRSLEVSIKKQKTGTPTK